jgi:hypothetical protein
MARAAAVREYAFGQRICIDAHMLVEHGFKYAAQIERGLETRDFPADVPQSILSPSPCEPVKFTVPS